jgi:hypothetical protein
MFYCALHGSLVQRTLLTIWPPHHTHSIQVPLGILPKNENKAKEMVDIVQHLHQYVPAVEYEEELMIPSCGESVMVARAKFSPVLLGGDQLTAARVRGAKKNKVSEDSPSDRMEGIVPG